MGKVEHPCEGDDFSGMHFPEIGIAEFNSVGKRMLFLQQTYLEMVRD